MTTVNDSPANGPSVADTARRGQASWRTTAAAGFLGLALIGGLVVALSGGGEDPGTTGATTPAAAAPADPSGAGAVSEPAPAKNALGDVTWELVSGRAVPSSPTTGPTKVSGPVHAGYAHTQDGAVLAALNIATRYAFTPSSGWLKVTTAQVEPGKGRDAFVKSRSKLGLPSTPAGGWGQTVGFQVVDYTATRAVISEAIGFASGALQARTLTIVWRDGDWHLVLQPDGDPSPPGPVLGGLAGYAPFSAGTF